MTVQANAAPLGLAWQNTACGSCTRRRTTLPEPKECPKLFCRKSWAETKELCPADHGSATCAVTITARKGLWLVACLPLSPPSRGPGLSVHRSPCSGHRRVTAGLAGHYREVLAAASFRTDNYGAAGDDGEQRSGISAGRQRSCTSAGPISRGTPVRCSSLASWPPTEELPSSSA